MALGRIATHYLAHRAGLINWNVQDRSAGIIGGFDAGAIFID
jgi:hypothetical protein